MGYKGYNYKTLPLVTNIALQYEHWLCMKGLGVGLVNTPPDIVPRAISGIEPKTAKHTSGSATALDQPDRGSCRTAGQPELLSPSPVSAHGRGHLLAVIFLLLWGARLSSGIAAL